jgi:hypothetical protein
MVCVGGSVDERADGPDGSDEADEGHADGSPSRCASELTIFCFGRRLHQREHVADNKGTTEGEYQQWQKVFAEKRR